MRRAVLLGALVTLAVLALTVRAAPEEDRPVALVGHAGAPAPPSTTTPPVPTTAMIPVPTTAKPTAAASRSSTVVRSDAGGRVTVVNEGSAVASTGGNTVIGPPDASMSNGPVSAVGNSSEVRVSRR